MTYEEYLEAREKLWQITDPKLKERITKTKQELQVRKDIMENERVNPQVSHKEKKVSAATYWQKYDELCYLENKAGLTEIAKNFCEAQARKMRR